MQIAETKCKSILTRVTGYLKPVCTHSLNPYSGCGFGRSACGVGCYVRFNQWLTRGREWGTFVEAKINAAEVYGRTVASERRWAQRQTRPFAVFFSSSTDPWQPAERQFRITRRILQAMLTSPPDELILQTHTARILDDVDYIQQLSAICDLRAHISIEGDRDQLPGLPPPPCSVADRLDAVEQLARRGITTVVCLSPLYPLKDPESFFERLADAGASAVIIDHFIEGDGTPDGSRTLKTPLPEAMAKADLASVQLDYRGRIADIAERYLPVGLSSAGFAGRFTGVR